jgi:hypothetical protein
MQFCNEKFFELTGHPQCEPKDVDWSLAIYPGDLHMMEASWKVLFEHKTLAQTQFRLMKTWSDSDGVQSQAWAQGQSSPELDTEGNVKTVLGTLTDISQLKWAEQIQQKRMEDQQVRMEDALESKQKQEK